MPMPPTAAMAAITHSSLHVAGLHDIERARAAGADPLRATVELVEDLSGAGSSAVWTRHREEEFRRSLAHKLRNPLAPVVTCLQILQSRAPQDRLLHHALNLMDRQLTCLMQLLDDLSGAHRNGAVDPTPEAQPRWSSLINSEDEKPDGLNGNRACDGALDGVRDEMHDSVNHQASLNLKHRVLIVDDNPDAAEALRLLLCIKGFEVFTASDGLEAIQCTKDYAPEVILMDLEMPAMDGCEAARRIHAMPECESIPIVALTGLDHDSDRERSHQSGMVEHLVKPVEVTAVQELLRSLIVAGRRINSQP